MTLYDQQEMEQYEQVSKDLAARGKLDILAMISNRLLKMLMKPEYVDDPSALSVIEDMRQFIQPILYEELVNLGELVQVSYSGFSDLWDLKSVHEVENEYHQLQSSIEIKKSPEKEKVGA